MNIQEYRQLQAEKTTLESLLEKIPEANVIERIGIEARKSEVEELLASQPIPPREPVRARLTFRGKPIVGSHGIFAEFGAKALNTFADAVAAIGASQTSSLGARGVIPNRDEYQLLITGTALGSFGFELEETPKDNLLFPEISLIEPALEQTRRIMEASLGTDDELTDAISEADPRAVESLRSFLKTIADQEAICALELKGDVFRFADVAQVRRSESRLSKDNIHEENQTLTGHFLGVLPNRRNFEFHVEETETVIVGKVGPKIEDASEINNFLNKPMKIEIHARRVGAGLPRFVLLGYKEISDLN